MNTKLQQEDLPTQPRRLISFANFFKSYMSVSALITACLPIPVTALNLIPTFKDQSGLLSVYTSLFCFLLLAFIFYIRHSLAHIFFPLYFMKNATPRYKLFVNITSKLTAWILPLLFIGLSMRCVLFYHTQLNAIVGTIENWAHNFHRMKQLNLDGHVADSIHYQKNKPVIDSIQKLLSNYDDSSLQHQHDSTLQHRYSQRMSDLRVAFLHYRGGIPYNSYLGNSNYDLRTDEVERILPVDTTGTLLDSIDQKYILNKLSTPAYMASYTDKSVNREQLFNYVPLDYLMINYFGIFLFAEAAFILMAIKEYLQDYLKLNDRDLMN